VLHSQKEIEVDFTLITIVYPVMTALVLAYRIFVA